MTTIPEWYDRASLVITAIGLFNCVWFCVGYWWWTRGSWHKSEYGWFLMLFVGCLGTLFALILSNRIFGAWPYRFHVSLGLYASYVLTTMWLPRLVWVSNRSHGRRAGNEKQEGNMNRTKAPAIFMGIAAVVMAGLTVVRQSMADQHVSAEEWVLVVLAVAGAVQVWGAANIPGFAKAKTFFAVLTGVLALLVTLISGGLTLDEIILLVLEAGGILGVVAGPQPPASAVLPAGAEGTTRRMA